MMICALCQERSATSRGLCSVCYPTNQNVRFSGLFNTIPVVLTTIASENEVDTISHKIEEI